MEIFHRGLHTGHTAVLFERDTCDDLRWSAMLLEAQNRIIWPGLYTHMVCLIWACQMTLLLKCLFVAADPCSPAQI